MKTKLQVFILLSFIVLLTSFTVSCIRTGFTILRDQQLEVVKNLRDDYLYQEGCDHLIDYKPSKNDEFHYFYGDPMHRYSSYIFKNNKPIFNGNFDNMMQCTSTIPTLKTWRNQYLNFQIILLTKKNYSVYSDINTIIKGSNFETSYIEEQKDIKITGWSRFLKYIDVNPTSSTGGSRHMLNERNLIPDIIGEEHIDNMKYEVQPIYVSMFIGKKVNPGIQKMNLEVSYKYNNIKKNMSILFTVDINEKTLNKSEYDNNFGFTVQDYKKSIGLFDSSIGESKIQRGPTTDYKPAWLNNSQGQKALRMYLKPLSYAGSRFSFTTGYHKPSIQWTARYKNPNNLTEEQVKDQIVEKKRMKTILENEADNWKFEFDRGLSNLKAYLKIIAEEGFDQMLLSLIENGNFNSWVIVNGQNNDNMGITMRWQAELIKSKNGKLVDDYWIYEKMILKPLMLEIGKMIKEGYKTGDFISTAGNKVKIMLNTDELNESSMHTIYKLVKEMNNKLGEKIFGMNSFIGWRSDIDLKSESYLKQNFYNSFDQYIFHFREATSAIPNSSRDIFRETVQKRKKNGLSTLYYSTFNEYPGTYIGSDTFEIYWNIFNAKSLGLDGFARWAYDNVYDDYYKKEVFTSWGKEEKREPGQSFLIYGGSLDKGIKYSVRMKGAIDAVQYTRKYDYLLKKGIAPQQLANAIKSIGFNYYGHNNDAYKWYPNIKFDYKFIKPKNNYKKTFSMQVYEFAKFIDSL